MQMDSGASKVSYVWGVNKENLLAVEAAYFAYARFLAEVHFRDDQYRQEQFADCFMQLVVPVIVGVHRPTDAGKRKNEADRKYARAAGRKLSYTHSVWRKTAGENLARIDERVKADMEKALAQHVCVQGLEECIAQVINWLVSAVKVQSTWLSKRENNGAYRRLAHMRRNVPALLDGVNKDFPDFCISNLWRGHDYTLLSCPDPAMAAYNDLYRFIEIRTLKGLMRVSMALDNCIINTPVIGRRDQINYEAEFRSPLSTFYAMCDGKGKILSLIWAFAGGVREVGEGHVREKGGSHHAFTRDHLAAVGAFIRNNRLIVTGSVGKTGFVTMDAGQTFFDLKGGEHFPLGLDLRGINQPVALEGSVVRGDFRISGPFWQRLPGIRADRAFVFYCDHLKEIPASFSADHLFIYSLVEYPSREARVKEVTYINDKIITRMSWDEYCNRCEIHFALASMAGEVRPGIIDKDRKPKTGPMP